MAKTILAVDDDRNIVFLLKTFLSEHGYHVVGAYNGDEAIEKAQSLNPDLIILDVSMPRMDGDDAYIYLRSQEATKDIPVLFLTGLRSEEEIKEKGEENVIAKPANLEELLVKVKQFIRK